MYKLFLDTAGKPSPKRLFGSIAFLIWLILSIVIILKITNISDNQIIVLNNIGYISGGLLGIGVLEKLKK